MLLEKQQHRLNRKQKCFTAKVWSWLHYTSFENISAEFDQNLRMSQGRCVLHQFPEGDCYHWHSNIRDPHPVENEQKQNLHLIITHKRYLYNKIKSFHNDYHNHRYLITNSHQVITTTALVQPTNKGHTQGPLSSCSSDRSYAEDRPENSHK